MYLQTRYRSKLGWFFWFGPIHLTVRRNLGCELTPTEPREDELGLIDNGDEDDDFDVIGELDRTDEKEVSDKEQLEPSDRRSPTRCRRRMRCRRRCKCGGIPCTYCSCKRCPTRATRATATANLNLGGATYTVTLQKSRSRCSGGFRRRGRCLFRRRRLFRRKG